MKKTSRTTAALLASLFSMGLVVTGAAAASSASFSGTLEGGYDHWEHYYVNRTTSAKGHVYLAQNNWAFAADSQHYLRNAANDSKFTDTRTFAKDSTAKKVLASDVQKGVKFRISSRAHGNRDCGLLGLFCSNDKTWGGTLSWS